MKQALVFVLCCVLAAALDARAQGGQATVQGSVRDRTESGRQPGRSE